MYCSLFKLLNFNIFLANCIWSLEFDTNPDFDSLIILLPIPSKLPIMGFPEARYDCSFPGIVKENITFS